MIKVEHEVLDSIQADLMPWLREHGAESEKTRKLTDEVAQKIRESGVMRLIQPARCGGYEADPQVFYEAVRLMGTADPAAAWVTGVVGVHSYQVGLYNQQAQDEVFGDNPDAWISSHYQPHGVLTPVSGGGYRLSGHWHFSSGSDHCQWVFVGARKEDGSDGSTVDLDNWYHVLVPREDYEVRDVWDVIGLRGTGSNDIIVEDVFVPEHRVLSWNDLTTENVPGREVNTGPLFRMPWTAMFGSTVAAPMLGIGYGVFQEYVKSQQPKPGAEQTRPIMGDWHILRAIAEAAGDLDAAREMLLGNLIEMFELVKNNQEIPRELRQRTRRDQIMAGIRALRSADAVFEHAGGRALGSKNVLQRMWRDIHGARAHVVNSPNMTLAGYATELLGGQNFDMMGN